jgi:hypothetical protein
MFFRHFAWRPVPMLRVLAISIGRMPSAFSDDDCLARDHVSDKVPAAPLRVMRPDAHL